MSKTKIYISGKITGLQEHLAYAAFADASDYITKLGAEPINPMDLDHDHDKRWESYMKVCMAALLDSDIIFMLPNWGNSLGARVERAAALELGKPIIYHDLKELESLLKLATVFEEDFKNS
jgi:hypothetical protein